MVALPIVRSSNTALVQSQPLVAVFVGGTSGISEYTLRALAKNHASKGLGLRAYIVGRKASAAEKIIADCRTVCPSGDFRFVKAEDLSLLRDVDRVCAEIQRLEEERGMTGEGKARVDILVMSQHYFPLLFEGRKDTSEGLDTSVSLLYYSRMHFAYNLLPLLNTSTLPSGARIISIYAAGMESTFNTTDISLRNPKNYSMTNARSQVCFMKTFFFEKLAEQNPGKLSCVHIYPSLVMTESFKDKRLPLWFRVAWWVMGPVAKLFSTSEEEIGERVLFLATKRYPARAPAGEGPVGSGKEGAVNVAKGTDGCLGGGAYAVNWNGETVDNLGKVKKAREEGMEEKVWDHTMQAFSKIAAGEQFTD